MRISSKLGIVLLAILLATTSILAACSSDDEDTSEGIQWTGDPIVQTMYGTVEGFEDEENTWVWKAIPYAKPPVDKLRWEAPQNPEPWESRTFHF